MSLTHRPLGLWLLIALASGLVGQVNDAWAAGPKEVLVLYSTGRDAPMSIAGDRELPRFLQQGLQEGLTHYSEYIDQGRFPEPGYQAAFSDFLRAKYAGRRFDLLIAVQDAAVEFVRRNQHELFPDTQVVFLAISRPSGQLANSTGLIAELDLANTVELALALQPDIRHVFVVSGAGVPDKRYEKLAREQLRTFERQFSVTYLSGLPTNDLEARLRALPEHSIVYYLVVYEDAEGESLNPSRYLERIAAIARAPTYSWVDTAFDRGIVGGSLLEANAMMEATAKLALRVLQGERADRIPVSAPDLHVSQVDWRQLRRWGISEARVPAGARVLFRDPSAWERYEGYIVSAGVLLLAQTLLIAGLLVQRARRRQAEEQVRGSQAALVTSYERIRDLGGRLLNAQEGERARIARELHDDISQQMALLEIDLEQLGGSVQGDAEELAGEALYRAQSISKSVHDLSHRLHPAKLRLLGLIAAVNGLQRELSRPNIAITFTHDNVPPALPQNLTLCLFRIVQEALQNALKYSEARKVSVHLSGASDRLMLTIVDDGVGFDVPGAWGKGLGLISMKERLDAVGGTLTIHSKAGAGTRLEIAAPLAVQATESLPDSA